MRSTRPTGGARPAASVATEQSSHLPVSRADAACQLLSAIGGGVYAPESSYPLDVAFCEDCSLVQTPDVIDPEVLFRDYIYVSGTSDSVAPALGRHTRHTWSNSSGLGGRGSGRRGGQQRWQPPAVLSGAWRPRRRDRTRDQYRRHRHRRRRRHGERVLRYLDGRRTCAPSSTGQPQRWWQTMYFAHVDHTLDFLQGCKRLLCRQRTGGDRDRPISAISWKELEYDTIYHEHLCYFSVTALLRACDEVGLSLVRLDHHPVHGGSLRMHAGHPGRWGGHDPQVLAVGRSGAERRHVDPRAVTGVSPPGWKPTGSPSTLSSIDLSRESGKTVAAYGAPAKGNTLLNYCEYRPGSSADSRST